ncbi:MAG: bifunctional folylpolyglutamate synthase/dihydrofolate synthase [Clostridia bacterium]|nr:bifunctional folylpolyglutamate synthase/dihydrofolate synthase [Clostridia bacterium]
MTYDNALEYIHSFLKFGSKPGLERILALLEKLGNPQKNLRIVHVAGTNGKGSISTMLSNIFIADGKKTGLFTSPYIVDFCERIQVNGEMIPHEKLAGETAKIRPIVEELNSVGIEPTEFEIITAMAFDYYNQENCDIVVLEVGLGGLLDSTNVVEKPLASVITSISFDHTEILGNTLTEIAEQKCGIIKSDSVTVAYPLQELEVIRKIRQRAGEKNNRLVVPDLSLMEIAECTFEKTVVKYKDNQFTLRLFGEHQIYNMLTAVETAFAVGVDAESIQKGIENTSMPARVEFLDKRTVLDGGHNESGTKMMSKVLSLFENNIVVVSMMADKDVENSVKNLSTNSKIMIATECSNPRAMKADELKKICSKYCNEVYAIADPFEAIDKADELKGDNLLAVCGSLYLASEVREHLKTKIE